MEGKENELVNTDTDNSVALELHTDVGQTLFSLLDPKTRAYVVLAIYISSVSLGAALALIAFNYEWLAQTRHLDFEMRDWMVALIIGLLSLPPVGAFFSRGKH